MDPAEPEPQDRADAAGEEDKKEEETAEAAKAEEEKKRKEAADRALTEVGQPNPDIFDSYLYVLDTRKKEMIRTSRERHDAKQKDAAK